MYLAVRVSSDVLVFNHPDPNLTMMCSRDATRVVVVLLSVRTPAVAVDVQYHDS